MSTREGYIGPENTHCGEAAEGGVIGGGGRGASNLSAPTTFAQVATTMAPA